MRLLNYPKETKGQSQKTVNPFDSLFNILESLKLLNYQT